MSTTQAQTVRGTVVKRSSAQTVRVATKVTKVHPIYKKRFSRIVHYTAHDESNTIEVGAEVTIKSCRPISKNKHWIVV